MKDPLFRSFLPLVLVPILLTCCKETPEDLVVRLGDANKVKAFQARDSILRRGEEMIPLLIENLDNLNVANRVMDILVDMGSHSIMPLIKEIEEDAKREPIQMASYLDPSIYHLRPDRRGLMACTVLCRIGIESAELAIDPFIESIKEERPSRPYYIYLYQKLGEKAAPILYEQFKKQDDKRVLENIIFIFENFPKGLNWLYTFISQENYEKLFHIKSPFIRRFVIRSLSYDDFGYFRGKVALEYPPSMRKDPSDPLPPQGIGCVNIFRKHFLQGVPYLRRSLKIYREGEGYFRGWDREEKKAYLDTLLLCYDYMAEDCAKRKASSCQRVAEEEKGDLNALLSELKHPS